MPRSAPRGGIQKRRTPSSRTDRDGDLEMDGPSERGGGRARSGKGRGDTSHQANGAPTGSRGRTPVNNGPPRGLFSGATLQKAIARGLAVGDANLREPQRGADLVDLIRNASGRSRAAKDSQLDQLIVRGLKQSKAATNPDGGLKDLLAFLERKASGADPKREPIRIRKSRPEGDAVIVYVRKEDTPRVVHLNGFGFAGTTLSIEVYIEDVAVPSKAARAELTEEARTTRQLLTRVLTRRYNPELKLLDLSALGKDPDLVGLGAFDKTSTTSKFFPALMAICDSLFTDQKQKQEAVASVSLADNELNTVANVTTLAQTFPDLKNLDLSKNKFETMGAIHAWRWKFRSLEHLVLTGNPIEKVDPNYKDDAVRWYPALRLLNTIQVRTDEEVAALTAGKLPLPILGASFRDEGQIGENFVKHFFPAYDLDRNSLVSSFYDDTSTFSYSVNPSAPRAQATTDKIEAANWEAYIKGSRNLMKINHLPARTSRIHTGQNSIRQRWTTLPATRHPDLLQEGQKWLIECHSLPALPDPTGQSPAGVGGLVVMVHGDFSEMNVSTGQATATRSFDRTFVLGPGGTPNMPIRVISDIVTYRAWGGSDAWVPEVDVAGINGAAASVSAAPIAAAQNLQLPDGFGQPQSGKPAEQLQQEQMMIEMSRRTNMKLPYSKMALEEKGWNFDEAVMAFEAVKGQLPPDAFL